MIQADLVNLTTALVVREDVLFNPEGFEVKTTSKCTLSYQARDEGNYNV